MRETASCYQQMRAAVERWVEMPASQWNEFAALFRVETFGRQDPVLLPGSMDYTFFFVAEGLLRVYTVAGNSKECNKGFIADNIFAGPLAAFMLGLPSLYGIEALEPTTLLTARYSDLIALYDRHPVFDRFGRTFMEWMVIQKELRERITLHQTAKERYLAFMEQYPQFAQRVPQYHIASYLGITPESLSRLRRTLVADSIS